MDVYHDHPAALSDEGEGRLGAAAVTDRHGHDDRVRHPAGRHVGHHRRRLPEACHRDVGTEPFRDTSLEGNGINGHDRAGAGKTSGLDGVRTDPADPDHHDRVAGTDLGGVQDGSPSGDTGAGDGAGGLKRQRGIDDDATRLIDDRVLGKGTEKHEDAQILAAGMMAGGAVGDLEALPDQGTPLTEVREGVEACGARPARRQRNAEHDMVAGTNCVHPGSDGLDDARSLVAADNRPARAGIPTVEQVVIAVAQAGGHHPDQDLTRGRRVEGDLLNAPLRPIGPQHCRTCPHRHEIPSVEGDRQLKVTVS